MTKTILIAEDDSYLLDMYQAFFTDKGYTVLAVNDGAAAIQLALEKHPDVLVLDFNMPKMDGISVLEHLRQDTWGKTVKIFILSNFDPGEQKRNEITADNNTVYLLKTENDPQTLVTKVTEHLS